MAQSNYREKMHLVDIRNLNFRLDFHSNECGIEIVMSTLILWLSFPNTIIKLYCAPWLTAMAWETMCVTLLAQV